MSIPIHYHYNYHLNSCYYWVISSHAVVIGYVQRMLSFQSLWVFNILTIHIHFWYIYEKIYFSAFSICWQSHTVVGSSVSILTMEKFYHVFSFFIIYICILLSFCIIFSILLHEFITFVVVLKWFLYIDNQGSKWKLPMVENPSVCFVFNVCDTTFPSYLFLLYFTDI